MTTNTVAKAVNVIPLQRPLAFERFAGACGIMAGLVGFSYALAFVVFRSQTFSALFLMLGGLLSSAVLVALYERVRHVDHAFALWALVLSGVGALGATIHGGYDLANAVHALPASPLHPPSEIDPRGLLTFGLSGVGLFVNAWLIGRGTQLPTGLSYVGYASALLSVALYLGRLIVLTPASPIILVPALLEGFLVNPAWYVWLGLSLWRGADRA